MVLRQTTRRKTTAEEVAEKIRKKGLEVSVSKLAGEKAKYGVYTYRKRR